MKKFLFIGAILMVGASIYGFVDYSKTKHSKRFNNLYKETEAKATVLPAMTEEDKSVSEADLPDVKKEAVKNSNVSKPGIVKKPVKQKIQKPRKLKLESFSRAPLREVVVEKKEAPKTEIKKQE